jgi:hypothetical protein
MRFRRPTRGARFVFVAMLAVFGLLAVTAAWFGWWVYALTSLLLAVLFVASAPFVLGQGWKPHPPRRTRRPVVRRRR